MWAVVDTNYKNGEYELRIFKTRKELEEFLYDKLAEYEGNDYDGKIKYTSLKTFIETVVRWGNHRVENQDGWGVREVRKLRI